MAKNAKSWVMDYQFSSVHPSSVQFAGSSISGNVYKNLMDFTSWVLKSPVQFSSVQSQFSSVHPVQGAVHSLKNLKFLSFFVQKMPKNGKKCKKLGLRLPVQFSSVQFNNPK